MGVMSIRISDKNKKLLKIIASYEGKTIGKLIGEMLEDYIDRNKDRLSFITAQEEHGLEIMKLSEEAFSDWDNTEDDIYNEL